MFSTHDLDVLRNLAVEKARIADQPSHAEKIELWRNLNDLKMTRPMIWTANIPWKEMNYNDELTMQCEDKFCRDAEFILRKEIYLYHHMKADMVVTNVLYSPPEVHNTGFGIDIQYDDENLTDNLNGVRIHAYKPVLKGPEDIEKITAPVITLNKSLSEENYQKRKYIFDGILNVVKSGARRFGGMGTGISIWDFLIPRTGIEEGLTDLAMRPDYINALASRFVDMSLILLEQYNELGLWASNTGNNWVGSGAYGYVSCLDSEEMHYINAPTSQIWGSGNAQVFSEVSPEMHWEFSLRHEIRWLSHFGLNYYGCCEQLHNKVDILDKVPNLRKISTSAWCDFEKITRDVGGRYVLSLKPNPAYVATDVFDEQATENDLADMLEKTKGANVEMILKDITTVRSEPQRLWKWVDIANRAVDRVYGKAEV